MKSALFTATLFCLLLCLVRCGAARLRRHRYRHRRGHITEITGRDERQGKAGDAFNDRLAGLLLERLHAAGFPVPSSSP